MDVILATGAQVSKQSIPFLCLVPFATNLVLKVCIDPLVIYFLLNTHLQPIGFEPVGRSTRTQVLLDNIESISSFTASFQKAESLEAIASSNVLELSSVLKHYGYFIQGHLSISFNKKQLSLIRNEIWTKVLYFFYPLTFSLFTW